MLVAFQYVYISKWLLKCFHFVAWKLEENTRKDSSRRHMWTHSGMDECVYSNIRVKRSNCYKMFINFKISVLFLRKEKLIVFCLNFEVRYLHRLVANWKWSFNWKSTNNLDKKTERKDT